MSLNNAVFGKLNEGAKAGKNSLVLIKLGYVHKISEEITQELHELYKIDLGRKNAGYYRFGAGKKANNG